MTVPSSSMSILVPVVSQISRIILPPGPITMPILSCGMWITLILGTDSRNSARAPLMPLAISSRMCSLPARAWVSAWSMIASVIPAILMSICSEVTPMSVPATLKSMSPR